MLDVHTIVDGEKSRTRLRTVSFLLSHHIHHHLGYPLLFSLPVISDDGTIVSYTFVSPNLSKGIDRIWLSVLALACREGVEVSLEEDTYSLFSWKFSVWFPASKTTHIRKSVLGRQ